MLSTQDPPPNPAVGEPRNTVDELQRLCTVASGLVEDLDSQRAREAAAFEEGYRLAFDAGREVGYRQAEADMEAAWKPVAESVRNIPRLMQIQERRYPGYTPERLAELRDRARERFGLPSRRREGA